MSMEVETSKTVRRVQVCEVEILGAIDEVCKKYNLTYFGVGGTVLGAVRHKGFIPWDDDIDIAMPREDYEKFLEVAGAELSPEYHLQHISTEPNSPFYFTKVRKNGTKFIEYYLRGYRINHGIFVDIFPFDAIPDEPRKKKLHYRICRIASQLFLCKSLKTVYSSRYEMLDPKKKNNKNIARRLLHFCLLPIPKRWLFGFLDRRMRRYNGRDTRQIGYGTSKWMQMEKAGIYPVICLPFENMEIPVPANYEAYLVNKFGNYWELPPEEKRYGHLPYRVEFEVEE